MQGEHSNKISLFKRTFAGVVSVICSGVIAMRPVPFRGLLAQEGSCQIIQDGFSRKSS